MSELVQLLEQEPFAQVMSEGKHPADFARSEEDAQVRPFSCCCDMICTISIT